MCNPVFACRSFKFIYSELTISWQVVGVGKELHRCACLAMVPACKFMYVSLHQVWFSKCPQCATAVRAKDRESAIRTAVNHVEAERSCNRTRSWRSILIRVRLETADLNAVIAWRSSQQILLIHYMYLNCRRNERWSEAGFPWRRRSGARNRARWHHHSPGPARTSTFHQVTCWVFHGSHYLYSEHVMTFFLTFFIISAKRLWTIYKIQYIIYI